VKLTQKTLAELSHTGVTQHNDTLLFALQALAQAWKADSALAEIYSDMATNYSSRSEYLKAKEYLVLSNEIYAKRKDTLGMGYIFQVYGDIENWTSNYRGADSLYSLALNCYRIVKDTVPEQPVEILEIQTNSP
jgi:hypothetical protein